MFLKIRMKKLRQSETVLAAKKYDLHIAEENIHDFHFNHTRFVVLSLRKGQLEVPNHTDTPKTMLMVKLPEDDRSGMLHQVLSVFSWRKLNLSKIESRPLKTGLGNYFFIIDVVESEETPMMKGAMEELRRLDAPFDHLALTIRTKIKPLYPTKGCSGFSHIKAPLAYK